MDFKSNTKIYNDFRLSLGRPIFFFSFLISLVFIPIITHASVASFFSDIFGGQSVSAQAETVVETSSQTMVLLEPATNFDLSVKAGSDVIIDNGEALLPEVGPSTDEPEKMTNSNDQISTYIVRSGDTLASIAEMFDVSVNTILWANDMTKGSVLKIGQDLVILPISGVRHTVVSGDTLVKIASKYNGDIDEIASFNDLAITAKLAVGDVIMIPDGQVSSSIRPSASSNSSGAKINYASGPSYAGYYIKPFVGGHKSQGIHGYNGVDYGMPVGTTLYAAAQGTVIISKNSGYNGGYGKYIVIKHPNNTQTVYGHMSDVVVTVGQSVTQGQTIGYSGNTGRSTGPHLHFEVRGAKNPF
jgi:murein DD-endopeptidase MepM/ murein hydrolase activator NlpD